MIKVAISKKIVIEWLLVKHAEHYYFVIVKDFRVLLIALLSRVIELSTLSSPPNYFLKYKLLRPCHTIAYRTSVCQRMKNISHTLLYADIR